ncbi:hypothetical protein MMC10_007563 [Thelotrema lepadinum]|nr:hypothetical protein [Thelotrema lepadinum]
MATTGSKRPREALEEPEEPLLEPCCLRCSKNVLGDLWTCGGWTDGRRTCTRCHKNNRSCDEVPACFVSELNNLIRIRDSYFESTIPSKVAESHKTQQKTFTKELEAYVKAAEKCGIIAPTSVPHNLVETSLLQLHESRLANKRLCTLNDSLLRLNDTFVEIAGHFSVLAAATKPTKGTVPTTAPKATPPSALPTAVLESPSAPRLPLASITDLVTNSSRQVGNTKRSKRASEGVDQASTPTITATRGGSVDDCPCEEVAASPTYLTDTTQLIPYEVPAQFIPELNFMIDECNKYLPGTSRENIEKCKQHQLAFNQEIEAYVKATEGSDTIVLEPMKTPNQRIDVAPPQLEESRLVDKRLCTINESILRLNDTLTSDKRLSNIHEDLVRLNDTFTVIAGHFGVLAEAAKPKKVTIPVSAPPQASASIPAPVSVPTPAAAANQPQAPAIYQPQALAAYQFQAATAYQYQAQAPYQAPAGFQPQPPDSVQPQFSASSMSTSALRPTLPRPPYFSEDESRGAKRGRIDPDHNSPGETQPVSSAIATTGSERATNSSGEASLGSGRARGRGIAGEEAQVSSPSVARRGVSGSVRVGGRAGRGIGRKFIPWKKSPW